jgi:hypothetical protein
MLQCCGLAAHDGGRPKQLLGLGRWAQPMATTGPRDAHAMAAGCGAASDGSSMAGNHQGKETRAVAHQSDESTVRRQLRFGNGCSTTASGEVLVGLAGELLLDLLQLRVEEGEVEEVS